MPIRCPIARSIGFLTVLLMLSLTCGAAIAENACIKLPDPAADSEVSVEEAIRSKHTVRSFEATPLTQQTIGQMLWAANGKLPLDAATGATSRVIPSAGGLYPLEVFLVTGEETVTGLAAGVYAYDPAGHCLKPVKSGDQRKLVSAAALSQSWIAQAPALIVIGGVYARTSIKYGERATRYVHMEAGNANQNLYLQAESLGVNLGTVGAFNDGLLSQVLKLPDPVAPLLVVALGR